MSDKFKIKEITNTNSEGRKLKHYEIFRRRWFLFWEKACKSDLALNKSISYPSSIMYFDSIEDARNGIEKWKETLAITNKKVKVLKPV